MTVDDGEEPEPEQEYLFDPKNVYVVYTEDTISIIKIKTINAPVVAAVFSRARCDYLCFT